MENRIQTNKLVWTLVENEARDNNKKSFRIFKSGKLQIVGKNGNMCLICT